MGCHRARGSAVANFLSCLTFQVSWYVSPQLSLLWTLPWQLPFALSNQPFSQESSLEACAVPPSTLACWACGPACWPRDSETGPLYSYKLLEVLLMPLLGSPCQNIYDITSRLDTLAWTCLLAICPTEHTIASTYTLKFWDGVLWPMLVSNL